MSETDIILQVIGQLRSDLGELGSKLDTTVAGLGEVKTAQRVHGLTLERVLEQTTKTNGRVASLEDRVDLIERRAIRDQGIEDGKREQREAYRSTVTRAWDLLWSPMGKAVGAVALMLTGWTLREVWPL